jgi:hypothetical protein
VQRLVASRGSTARAPHPPHRPGVDGRDHRHPTVHRHGGHVVALSPGTGLTQRHLLLLKMDFLGLRNLTVIGDAIANVRSNIGPSDRRQVTASEPARTARSRRPRTGARTCGSSPR